MPSSFPPCVGWCVEIPSPCATRRKIEEEKGKEEGREGGGDQGGEVGKREREREGERERIHRLKKEEEGGRTVRRGKEGRGAFFLC